MLICNCSLAGTAACQDCSRWKEEMRGWRDKEKYEPQTTIPKTLETGWICPRCGTVLAPFMPFCVCGKTYQEGDEKE
jgi:hypothetical protein